MEKLIHVDISDVSLEGVLKIPQGSNSIIVFAHGSGSGRHSPRNNFVADVLNKAGLGTLLIDLLTENEDQNYQTRFDINLLTSRLAHVVSWLEKQPEAQKLGIGLFGASTGAAAALQVAAQQKAIKAVVSRGGRPDLALSVLPDVSAPTLLIVGGNDFGVIELNLEAYSALTCTKEFSIVPNATHLFEEPGTLEQVAEQSANWFKTQLAP